MWSTAAERALAVVGQPVAEPQADSIHLQGRVTQNLGQASFVEAGAGTEAASACTMVLGSHV